MHQISKLLNVWYNDNKRDLPWRDTKDPYKIWLSEVILQQTQVIQGLSYYLKFIENFPTVTHLANAPEDLVMRLWQGLGYYSRARNLHFAAKQIEQEHKGVFPKTYVEIKNLKGVGDYTAAAIASLAYKLPYAVVDGNVYRVLSRVFDINTPINSSQGKKEFQTIANEILDIKNPDIQNSALMELGALVCKPQNPKCDICPIVQHCLAHKNKNHINLPVKTNKTKVRNRYFNYFVFNYNDFIYIKKRTKKDIWQNLYEFYIVETEKETELEELLLDLTLNHIINKSNIKTKTKLPKHILSHQHIYTTFYEVDLRLEIEISEFVKVERGDLKNFGTSQLIQKYLNTNK